MPVGSVEVTGTESTDDNGLRDNQREGWGGLEVSGWMEQGAGRVN